ncbi:uncharacterized protein LOC129238050 [Anastrepha obliqua]|uniref:uncharacterized protein LOC129238050 n=1 Tax=Anastrepha obliqua TaxID=95512 RepID=UPI0024091E33|nr:uncharacterized protein LOC129238050 [Anastrepha obliqua]
MKVKTNICEKFECVDKGSVQMFLGMQIERDGELGDISVGQSQYIKDLLRQHRIDSCRPASTPLDAGFQVACDSENCKRVDGTSYQSIIGALMWLALSTRPDIFHSVSKLAQRNKDPHSEHMAGIICVLRYLAATTDMKLHYRACKQPLKLGGGGDRVDRRSYTDYVFLLAGGPISWKSEKQDCVALSSTEAEYLSMSSAHQLCYLETTSVLNTLQRILCTMQGRNTLILDIT